MVFNTRRKERILAGRIGRISKGENSVFVRKRTVAVNVMPFGLCNAPVTFERLMESALARMSCETCLVYLDDIIVLGKSFDEHLS